MMILTKMIIKEKDTVKAKAVKIRRIVKMVSLMESKINIKTTNL